MNRKGENTMAGVGMFMGVFVLVIVGIALFQASAQNVGEVSDLSTLANLSIPATAVAGEAQYILNFKLIDNVVVYNATGGDAIPASNYTITNNVIDPTTGGLSVNITPIVTGLNATWFGVWTIDGTAQPLGYIPESGARSVASLIAIFFALAIAIVALEPTLRSTVLSMVGK